MYVKVLNQDGTVEEETLGLYTGSPLSNRNEDTSYNIIYQFISSDLSDSPIYAKEDILEKKTKSTLKTMLVTILTNGSINYVMTN